MASFAHAAPSAFAQYDKARSDLKKLQNDAKRNQWRDPWLQLADTFLTIYQKNTTWNTRPAALFRSAEAMDQLSRRSILSKDAHVAVERYEMLAQKHTASPLADDALLNSAKLQADQLNDVPGALKTLELLQKKFPKGDMVPAARTLAATLEKALAQSRSSDTNTSAKGNTVKTGTADKMATDKGAGTKGTAKRILPSVSSPSLTQVTWQSRRNLVRVTIELDRAVPWVVRSQAPDSKNGRPARLIVDLPSAAPDAQVKPGARVTGSLLTRLRVDVGTPGATRLMLDFSKLQRFTVEAKEGTPFKLVISATATDAALPSGKKVGQSVSSPQDTDSASKVQVPPDIAAQLGLGMRTVVVDAGHGGTDPGTEHYDIVEREIALDMAKRVGQGLQKRGYKVVYTRERDVKVSLENRSRIANQAKGDLFVSLHVNASSNEAISGFETYFLDFASSSSAARLAGVENALSDKNLGDLEGILADLMLGARTQESRRIAESIQRTTLNTMKKQNFTIRDGGMRSAPFHVLLGSSMPGVLVEVGYCSNKAEAKRLARPAYRAALAAGIVDGIHAFTTKLHGK